MLGPDLCSGKVISFHYKYISYPANEKMETLDTLAGGTVVFGIHRVPTQPHLVTLESAFFLCPLDASLW